jgi:uncharacterized Zn finger protein
VSSIESSDKRTAAVVDGSQPYRVELLHTDQRLEGACECPASEGIDFCKHCVAVALAVQTRQRHGEVLRTGTELEKVKAYLVLQPPEALVAELLAVLPRLPEVQDRLLLKAEIAGGTVSARGLKKTITQVTRPKHLWEYREVAAYFGRIEGVLENIDSVADELPADVLLELALYGIERLNRVLEHVDDSGGYRYTTQMTLRELHAKALARLEWPAERKARHVLDLASEDAWDQFSGVPDMYAKSLGEDGLAAFYSQVEARLDALPSLPKNADFDVKYPYLRLTHYLVARAEANGDRDALIALAKRTATNEREHQRIAELYLQKGDADAAASWLTKGDELAGQGRKTSSALWVEAHVARGDWAAAVEAQRRVFESQPSYAHYVRLIELASQAGIADATTRDAQAWLKAGHKSWWLDKEYAYTLAQIRRDDEDWEGVHAALVGRVHEADYLLDGARWLAGAAPARSCELYVGAIEATIQKKDKRSYQTAVEILAEAEPVFHAVDAAAFLTYVEGLRRSHRQKRNLIAALDGLR